MKGAARGLIIAAVITLGVCSAARAEESGNVTDADRVFKNFTREAAVVPQGQLRLELRGMTLNNDSDVDTNLSGTPIDKNPNHMDGGIIDVLSSYGLGKSSEIGADVPVIFQSTRRDSGSTSDQDIGDVQLYGKFKYSVAEHCAVAGGLELSLPTGIEEKGFGTGEFGVNPFVATRWQQGPYALGLHAGYEMYTGNVDDQFNYSAEGIYRLSPSFNFHVEFSGRTFNHNSTKFNDLEVLPGIDFNLSPELTIRPTGLAGLTDPSPDWGVGVGLVYTFTVPSFSLPKAPPPPPPMAAAEPAPPPPPARKKIVLRGVNFDFDKANIRQDAAPVLDEAVATLKEASTINIAVEGHTDSKGSDEYNQKLSERRADAVRDYLAGHGVSKSRMTSAGFGESRPVASNDTDEGRAQNRRVELRVTGE